MKINKSLRYVFLSFVIILFLIVFGISVSPINEVASAADALPVVKLVTDGIPSSNQITVKISLNKKSDEDINVTVSTFDWSAIAGIDYEKYNETLTIPAKSTSTTFNLKVYSVTSAGYAVVYNSVAYVRQFYLKIVSVSENATISTTDNSKLCSCNYNYSFNAKKKSSYYYFEAYGQDVKKDIPSSELGGFWTSGESHSYTCTYNYYSGHANTYNMYIKSGMANQYINAKGKAYCDDSLQWDAKIQILEGDNGICGIEIDGYWSDNYYNLGRLRSHDAGSDIEYGEDTFYYNSSDKNNPTKSKTYHTFGDEDYYKLSTNGSNIKFWWHINGGYNRKAYDWTLYVKTADITNPNILDWYMDEEAYEGNDSLYLRVRFSEPVQINESAPPSIVCGINGGDRQTCTFKYCAGNFTDTLVFAIPYTDITYSREITTMLPLFIENQTSIFDFGYESTQGDGNHKLQNCANGSNFTGEGTDHTTPIEASNALATGLKCVFDPRIPQIATKYDDVKLSGIAKSFSKQISVGNMSSTGSLYYEWNTSKSYSGALTNKATASSSSSSSALLYTVSASGYTGEYYLFLQAKSKNNRLSTKEVWGPFKFDNTPYSIKYYDSFDSNGDPNAIDEELSGYPYQQSSERNINLQFSQKISSCDSGVMQIYLFWAEEQNWNSETVFSSKLIYDASSPASSIVTDKNNTVIGSELVPRKENDINYYDISVNIEAKQTLGMSSNESKRLYLGFVIIDKLENMNTAANSTPINYQYYFDTRELFELEDIVKSTEPLHTVDSIGVYDYSKINPEFTFKFASLPNSIVDILVLKPSVSATEYQPYSEYFDAEYETLSPSQCKLKLKTSNPNAAGYYDISIKVATSTSVGYTKSFCLYYTNNKQEITNNYKTISAGEILTNDVYIVSGTYFYSLDTDNDVNKEYYGGTKSDVIFSSKEQAKAYLTYLEYKDMSLFNITDKSTVDAINTGTDPKLQRGDDYTCELNQVWLKYKRTTWRDSTSYQDWGVYFYSNVSTTNEININNFTNSLSNALNEIVDGILSRYGKQTYLNSNSGYLSKSGSPVVSEGQIHPKEVSFDVSNRGTKFTNAVQFSGDTNIYSPNIEYVNENYILASTIEWNTSDYSKSFINVNNSYVRINNLNNGSLKTQVSATGVYKIREIDENGVREYSVFLDYEAPTIYGTLYSSAYKNGTNRTFLDRPEEKEYNVTGQKFTINSVSTEYDQLAYIDIYKTGNGAFIETITKKQIDNYGKNGGYTLSKGRYYLDVYDRSGNNYRVYLVLNDTALEPKITETTNVAITLEIPDRNADDINIFEVKLDGKKIDVAYTGEKIRFTESGVYHFRIIDWYGNSKEIEYEFIRRIPEISWKYENNGKSIEYDPKKTGQFMSLIETAPQSYNLLTSSTTLTFEYDSSKGYEYVFTEDENFTKPNIYEAFTVSGTSVKVTSSKPWILKIWYTAYPEIYVTYNYVLDVSAPQIFVSYTMKSFTQEEDRQINASLEDADVSQILTADSIVFLENSSMNRTIINGSSVTADFLDVSIDDPSGLSSVVVKLNGKDYIKLDSTAKNIDSFTLTKNGSYVIEATDKLGNVSTFNFVNTANNGTRYLVDGEEVEIGNNLYKNIRRTDDNKYQYIKQETGNESQTIIIPRSTEVYLAYLITLSTNNKPQLLMIRSDGISLYRTQYTVALNAEEGYAKELKTLFSDPLFDGTIAVANRWVTLGTFFELAFMACIDSDGNFEIRVTPKNDGKTICTIETKVIIDKEIEPAYVKTVLSTYQSDITIKTIEGEKVKTNRDGTIICLNKEFVIYASDIPQEVNNIKISYNIVDSFEKYEEIYSGANVLEFDTSKDGFYRITITNMYKNQTSYTIHIATKCTIIVLCEYADNTKNNYTSEYEDVIYSNNTITIQVFSKNSQYVLTRNGIQTKPSKSLSEDDYYIVQLSVEGRYEMKITDEFRNVIIKEFVIKKEVITIPEGALIGWNEKALRRSENYTNNRLSVDITRLDYIKFVSVTFGGVETVLYNELSQNKYMPSNKELEECVGKSGDGEYTVIFRDIYGNRVSEKVNYRGTSTILISRLTRNSSEEESYSLEMAQEIGVYSNNTVTFNTQAKKAKLLVDGIETTFPKTIQFLTDVRVGELSYLVQYLDEYGFEYAIKVVLLRQTLKLELDTSVSTTNVDGVDTTKNSVIIKYDNDTTTTYTIDDGIKQTYKQGDVLFDDGVYRFTETDFAGNVATLIVKKDTMVEFGFFEGESDNAITNGVVVNDISLTFRVLNSDTTYIKKIYKDGEISDTIDRVKYSDAGKWEFIIADKIGNETYFSFTIISHRLNDFDYTTPYDFYISQVWQTDSTGVRVSYIHSVESLKNSSRLNLTEDGYYEIAMQSTVTGEIVTFNVLIDTSKPPVTLVGCQNGETTVETISLSGLTVGDIVYVYKNGELLETYDIKTTSDGPEISDGGKYKIVIVNNAGNETVLEFTRKHIANTAGSALIIVLMVALVLGLFIGMLLRNKSRTDK